MHNNKHRVGGTGPGSGHIRVSGWAAALLGALLVAGCSKGSSSPEIYELGSGSDSGPEEDRQGPSGDVIAELELAAPSLEDFVLRATVPVPPGTLLPGQKHAPLTLLDQDGRPVTTQVNVVSSYPDAARDGADVVEVLGRVERPAGALPGDRIVYQVSHMRLNPSKFRSTRNSRSFLSAPGSLSLHTSDVFGNHYSSDVLQELRTGAAGRADQRDGALVREWSTHEVLQCTDGESTDALPHFMGVHSFVSQWSNEDVLLVSFRVHNGMDGNSGSQPLDDAQGHLYFDSLELRVPAGWSVVSAFDDPFLGEPYQSDGWTFYPLIRPNQDGSLHILRQQGQFVRRVALAPEGQEELARAMVEEQGLAICRAGISPDSPETELWSWWNPLTSRWFAQNVRLPRIDEQHLPGLRASRSQHLDELLAALGDGEYGTYPFEHAPQGPYRPWGGPYGGMTGGVEIDLTYGIETLASASRDGYRAAQLMSRMYMDRQPTALYAIDGKPSQLESWLQEGPGGTYFPGLFNLAPLLPHNDPFGFTDAPQFQCEAVASMGLKPDYEQQLLNFKPIDIQHWTRYLRAWKLLSWLGNDALAKSEVHAAAEIYRMTYHEYSNSWSGNGSASWGLRAASEHVESYPGQGLGFGRASGWGLDIAASAYSLGSSELRDRFHPWFVQVVDVLETGQSDCGGYLQAQPHHSNGAVYRIRQNYESAITDNALRALANTAFRGRDDELAQRIDDIMVRRAYGTISPAFWSASKGAPHGTVAVGPHDVTQPAYCGDATDHWASDATDGKYVWNSLAYAFELTGDTVFVDCAAEVASTTNLANYFEQNQLSDVNNRFAMLTLVQALYETHE